MPDFNSSDIEQARILLRQSNHEDDIIAALHIVGSVQSAESVPDIMPHMRDNRPDVKSAVEETLLAIGQDAIPAIVEYLPQLEPEYHVSLQSLVETFWKDAGIDHIRQMMNHEDNRVRWAMAWTLSQPLRTIPPEDIHYIFEGLGEESLTAIRWAATQSLTALAFTSDHIPPELIRVALPVMVDNFKYGDVNLSESSVQAIALFVSPPHPAITAMLTADDAELQVAAVKVLTAWAQDEKPLDKETLDGLKTAMQSPNWQMANEVSRLRYVLSLSHPDILEQLKDIPDTSTINNELQANEDIRATGEIMLPPLLEDEETSSDS